MTKGIPCGNAFLRVSAAKAMKPIRSKRIFTALGPDYLESIIGLRQM